MPRRPVVAAIVSPGSSLFEFATAVEVFGLDRSELGVPWYRWKPCSVDPAPFASIGGLTVQTAYGLDDLVAADTVIAMPVRERDFPDELLDALRQAHRRGARIVSLCSGAFLLAAAGLVDGRTVATHWMFAEELAARYPEVDVDADVLYVDDGDILSSAGTAASIDLCLHIVRKDFGAEVAAMVARRMVVPPHRDGGQAQFIDRPIEVAAGRELFTETLEWVEEHLAEPIAVDQLAARSAMSPRTFARRFQALTGTTPHSWLTRQRVQLAQRLLETSESSVEQIAAEAGLGTAANLRLHFQRIVQTTPTQYRRAFRSRQPVS